jgi:hypothetical protein
MQKEALVNSFKTLTMTFLCQGSARQYSASGSVTLVQGEPTAPFNYTFVQADGTVDYAVAVPPKLPGVDSTTRKPLAVALHGAGDEAYSSFLPSSVPRLDVGIWTIIPTGRTPWYVSMPNL